MPRYSLRQRLIFLREGVFGKSEKIPWLLRRKTILVFVIFFLLSVVAGALLCIGSYRHYTRIGIYDWKRYVEPLYMLPSIVAMIYACIFLLWLAANLHHFRTRLLLRIPKVFTVPDLVLDSDERILFERSFCVITTPDGKKRAGRFWFTSKRIVHTTVIAPQRVGILLNQPEPDITVSFTFAGIERCGFGMNPDKKKHWTIIAQTREHYYFLFSNQPKMLQTIPERLGWRKQEIGAFLSWSPK